MPAEFIPLAQRILTVVQEHWDGGGLGEEFREDIGIELAVNELLARATDELGLTVQEGNGVRVDLSRGLCLYKNGKRI